AILHISGSALKAWWDYDALRLGASLAYYTLFAIAPVFLVATGIAGLIFNTEAVRGEIVNQLDHLVGQEGARAVQSLLDGASQRRAGIVATTIRQRRVRHRADRCVPRAPGRAEHGVACEGESGCAPQGVSSRSSALLRPGGLDGVSAAGLAR